MATSEPIVIATVSAPGLRLSKRRPARVGGAMVRPGTTDGLAPAAGGDLWAKYLHSLEGRGGEGGGPFAGMRSQRERKE